MLTFLKNNYLLYLIVSFFFNVFGGIVAKTEKRKENGKDIEYSSPPYSFRCDQTRRDTVVIT